MANQYIDFCSVCTLNVHFPNSSVGKESTCNTGDPGLIPGSGRSAGEGIDYPLQSSWASLVKNLPGMQETWVGKIPWRRELLPTPVFLPGESHGQRSLAGYSLWGHRVRHNWLTLTTLFSVFTVILWVTDYHHQSYFISGENHGPGRLSVCLIIPGLWKHRSRRTESSQVWLLRPCLVTTQHCFSLCIVPILKARTIYSIFIESLWWAEAGRWETR